MMTINKQTLLSRLEKFNIEINLDLNKSETGTEIYVTPKNVSIQNGFSILCTIGWRTSFCKLVFGNYSLPLIKALGSAIVEKRILALAFLKGVINKGYGLKFEINHSPVSTTSINDWPSEWNEIVFELSSKPFRIEDDDEVISIVTFEIESALGFILSLLDIEEFTDSEFDQEKLPEGAKSTIIVNKYERNIKNRIACINYYGLTCQVCGFDFERKYGYIGKGFIHVHHIIPVSALGEDYLINPITDLKPVCPNCHSMLHKKNPPLTIEELKSIIK